MRGHYSLIYPLRPRARPPLPEGEARGPVLTGAADYPAVPVNCLMRPTPCGRAAFLWKTLCKEILNMWWFTKDVNKYEQIWGI